MQQQVLFIQSAGEGAYEADAKLAASLQKSLGPSYSVRYPVMPDPQYKAWKAVISNEHDASDIILVGHAFGASILLKYLAEGNTDAAGVFLIGTPCWSMEGWEVEEFMLPEDFALPESLPVFLYHSRDDEVVPFEHLGRVGEYIPHAVIRAGNHSFNDDLSDIARDIRGV